MSYYSNLYRNVLWPGYEKLRGRCTHKLLAEANLRQWWPAEKLREWQVQELAALRRHARENCIWYRQNDTSFLTKTIIRAHRTELMADNYREKVFTHKTGGSTGEPLSFYMTRESYEWRNAMMLRGYGWAGALEGVKQFYIWGGAIGLPSLLTQFKVASHNAVLRRKIFNSFQLNPATLPDCLSAINRFQPSILIGYTSMLEYFARYLKTHGGLRTKITAIITAAEGVHSGQRELLQEVFNARVFASYGSREFKLIAMECERGGMHLSADNLSVEIIRNGQAAEAGAFGQVVITDLHNYGMPFICYEIGDVAAIREVACPCGRGLPMLTEVHGRVTDIIQSPSGKVLTGLFFPHLLKEFEWITQFQVVQKELDRLQLKLVVSNQPSAEHGLPSLRQEILSVLGKDMQLDVEFVGEIPRTVSGKHRTVISEIPVTI